MGVENQPVKPPRWWFQIFFIFTPNLGEDEGIFDEYFLDGLVQPPTSYDELMDLIRQKLPWLFKAPQEEIVLVKGLLTPRMCQEVSKRLVNGLYSTN